MQYKSVESSLLGKTLKNSFFMDIFNKPNQGTFIRRYTSPLGLQNPFCELTRCDVIRLDNVPEEWNAVISYLQPAGTVNRQERNQVDTRKLIKARIILIRTDMIWF